MTSPLHFPAHLWRTFAQSRAPVRCESGYLIYLQDTTATCFYYLKSGKVKSFTLSPHGDERTLRIYEPGAIFGEAAFFDELPRVSSAVALSPCEIIPIDRSLVTREFARDPQLAMSMVQYLARAVRLLSDQVDDLAFRPAPQRLARHLCALAPQGGEVSSTQDQLSVAISASRVTVNRILGDFQKNGWITRGYGVLRVVDVQGINEFASAI